MKEIEQLSQSIADSLVYFMKREKEMQSTNGKLPKLFKSIRISALPEESKFTHYLLITIPVLRQIFSHDSFLNF